MAKIKKISKYHYLELEDVRGDDVWFASDFHFDHANIIRMCSRPFVDVHEMNLALKQNWNSRIKPDDFMFILGDFCWSNDYKRRRVAMHGLIPTAFANKILNVYPYMHLNFTVSN